MSIACTPHALALMQMACARHQYGNTRLAYATVGKANSENSMCTYDYNNAMTSTYRNTYCNQTSYTPATAFNNTWAANTWVQVAFVFRTTTNVTTMYWCVHRDAR